jgi:hypothetical protein
VASFEGNQACYSLRETLENPVHSRENTGVIAGMDRVHGRQAARVR